jgi:hypothetical protein
MCACTVVVCAASAQADSAAFENRLVGVGPAGPVGGGSQTLVCGSCDAGGICDAGVQLTGGVPKECEDGNWASIAFPFNTGGADVNLLTATFGAGQTTAHGDIYITAGTCGGPDVTNILATLCGAITEDRPNGVPISFSFPTVATSATEPTWVILIGSAGGAFSILSNAATLGTPEAAYGNLTSLPGPENWTDLNAFGFGACYCISLGFGDQPTGACCLPDETCEDRLWSDCVDIGFVYNGDGVPCSEVNCVKLCGDDDRGNCCEANDNKQCDDADCCTLVCETVDPFCCEIIWDGFCAFMAVQLCTELCGCGGPDTGDCCTDTGNPACEDVDCCAAVCAVNPFCCDVEWDEICAGQAVELCFICQVPPNDNCADAIELSMPSLTFGWTLNATDDAEAFACGTDRYGGPVPVEAPGVWYTVTGTGTYLRASFCTGGGGADYDTKLHVYSGDCDELTCVTGNDDACPGALSQVNWCSEEGVTYYIFVSGWSGQTGAFNLWVEDTGAVCEKTLVIKQGTCPAPLNVRNNGQGVVPMLLVGDIEFDVSLILPETLALNAPSR